MNRVLIFLIRIYQILVSPILHTMMGPTAGCRHGISCSEFFIQSLREHGVVNGSSMGVRRIINCQPFSS